MQWLMINFTLPKEPSRVRVSVWRKLKKKGSINIGQSMWILPINDAHLIFFQEIAQEISQNQGTAYLLKSTFLPEFNDVDVQGLFNSARNEEYKEFLDKGRDFFKEIEKETKIENFSFGELEENEEEYKKLVEWLQKIMDRDFFSSSLRFESEQKLQQCRLLLEEFSTKVYSSSEKEGAI
ncbi:Chromate resistance protein ChrB [uncultured Sphaerochaeta sp.]|uniref:Chromate resistance protein ChrB n=1 Tax=uncultured Sphaerochaeta sp. TaxID=886478 RepID=UPI003749115B